MTKSGFSQRLTDIISSSPCNKEIIGEDYDWLIEQLQASHSYKTKALRPRIMLIPRMRKFGPKRQKFLCLVELNGKEQIVSKGKLIEELYPAKSKVTEANRHRSTVLASMRYCVADQISEYKDTVFLSEAKCGLTGMPINKCAGGYAIDHVKPFIQLVDEWLIKNNISYADIKLKGRGHKKHFANEKLWASWYDFHKANAILQPVCRSANSSAGKKGYEIQHLAQN